MPRKAIYPVTAAGSKRKEAKSGRTPGDRGPMFARQLEASADAYVASKTAHVMRELMQAQSAFVTAFSPREVVAQALRSAFIAGAASIADADPSKEPR